MDPLSRNFHSSLTVLSDGLMLYVHCQCPVEERTQVRLQCA